MRFDSKNFSYELILDKNNYPMKIVATYNDGEICKTCYFLVESKHWTDAINILKKQLGNPLKGPEDDF